jgi:hypothetical protein
MGKYSRLIIFAANANNERVPIQPNKNSKYRLCNGSIVIIYFTIYNNGNAAKMERQIQEKHQLSSAQRVFTEATLYIWQEPKKEVDTT